MSDIITRAQALKTGEPSSNDVSEVIDELHSHVRQLSERGTELRAIIERPASAQGKLDAENELKLNRAEAQIVDNLLSQLPLVEARARAREAVATAAADRAALAEAVEAAETAQRAADQRRAEAMAIADRIADARRAVREAGARSGVLGHENRLAPLEVVGADHDVAMRLAELAKREPGFRAKFWMRAVSRGVPGLAPGEVDFHREPTGIDHEPKLARQR